MRFGGGDVDRLQADRDIGMAFADMVGKHQIGIVADREFKRNRRAVKHAIGLRRGDAGGKGIGVEIGAAAWRFRAECQVIKIGKPVTRDAALCFDGKGKTIAFAKRDQAA